jgi:DNA polymerase-3 subunit alpha
LRSQRDEASGQSGLFGGMFAPEEEAEPPLPPVSDWTAPEKLAGEKEMLGYYVTGHPLDAFSEKLGDLRTHTTGTLEGLAKGVEVKLCGILTGIQKKRNKEGKPWAALAIEDHDGSVEAMAFTTAFEQVSSYIQEDRAVLIRGLVLPEEGGPPRISIQDIIPLENARVNLASLVAIHVRLSNNGADKAASLQQLFARKPGSAQVRLKIEKPRDFSVTLEVAARVRPDREFRQEVERICGPEALESL